MAAIYTVYTSPNHAAVPNHLPTFIVTPQGQPSNILYSYLHTNFNTENYLLTPSPQGDLCVAKLYPPRSSSTTTSASDPGHGTSNSSKVVRCEASRNLKWSIANTGVLSPIYKLSLPSPDSADLPLFQISKPNPNAQFWSMFYFAYAGHLIPPKRIEFGRIMKNPPGPGGGGTKISISGRTPEEKAVWQTLGDGNEDCVEWVVLCAALNLLDNEILKTAEKNSPVPARSPSPSPSTTRIPPPGSNPIPQAPQPQRLPPEFPATQSIPPNTQRPPLIQGGPRPPPQPNYVPSPPMAGGPPQVHITPGSQGFKPSGVQGQTQAPPLQMYRQPVPQIVPPSQPPQGYYPQGPQGQPRIIPPQGYPQFPQGYRGPPPAQPQRSYTDPQVTGYQPGAQSQPRRI